LDIAKAIIIGSHPFTFIDGMPAGQGTLILMLKPNGEKHCCYVNDQYLTPTGTDIPVVEVLTLICEWERNYTKPPDVLISPRDMMIDSFKDWLMDALH
jgi:hypothetical protein